MMQYFLKIFFAQKFLCYFFIYNSKKKNLKSFNLTKLYQILIGVRNKELSDVRDFYGIIQNLILDMKKKTDF